MPSGTHKQNIATDSKSPKETPWSMATSLTTELNIGFPRYVEIIDLHLFQPQPQTIPKNQYPVNQRLNEKQNIKVLRTILKFMTSVSRRTSQDLENTNANGKDCKFVDGKMQNFAHQNMLNLERKDKPKSQQRSCQYMELLTNYFSEYIKYHYHSHTQNKIN